MEWASRSLQLLESLSEPDRMGAALGQYMLLRLLASHAATLGDGPSRMGER